MGKPFLPDKDFINSIRTNGVAQTAKITGITVRNIYRRREKLEKKYSCQITSPGDFSTKTRFNIQHPERQLVDIENGCVVVFSDAHYWPGEPTTAHRALVRFVHEYEPRLVIANGDVIDGCTVSRHPPMGWEHQPDLADEIEVAKDRLHEIERACTKRTRKIWNLGNHDGRFETLIATKAPEYAKIHGVHLNDHFTNWESAWSTWINNETIVKHRWKGGDHAVWNNVVKSGKNIVTGHLHNAQVRPYDDYNGTRYGVDTGCIAEPYGPQFNYMEDNTRNWRSGFCILTFAKGQLLMPELVLVWDPETVQFRGRLIKV